MPAIKKAEFVMLLPRHEGQELLEHVTNLTPLGDLVLPVSTTKAIGSLLAEHQNATKLQERGLRPANRVLFCGPPGTGKTATAGAIALALGIPFVLVRQDALVRQFLGQTSAGLRVVFDFAKTTRAVILIDEADSIARSRHGSADSDSANAEMSRAVTSLLVMLEEQRNHSQSIIIAATNHEGVIDQAMWRRFDEVVQFKMPSDMEGAILLGRIAERYGHPITDLDVKTRRTLYRSIKGLSFADIERVTLSAVKHATIDAHVTIAGALLEALVAQKERPSGSRKRAKRK